jgi:hypothetical protein
MFEKLGLGKVDEFVYIISRCKIDFYGFLFSILVFCLDLSEENFHKHLGDGNFTLLKDTFIFAYVLNAVLLVGTRGQLLYAYINRPTDDEAARQSFHVIFEGVDEAYAALTAFSMDAVAVFLVVVVYIIGPADEDKTYTALMVLSLVCSLPRAAHGILYLFYLLGRAILKYFEKANRIYEGKRQSMGWLWCKFLVVLLPFGGIIALMVIFTHEFFSVTIYFLLCCGAMQFGLSVYTGLYPDYKETGSAGFPLLWFGCVFGAADVTTGASPPSKEEKQMSRGTTRSIV